MTTLKNDPDPKLRKIIEDLKIPEERRGEIEREFNRLRWARVRRNDDPHSKLLGTRAALKTLEDFRKAARKFKMAVAALPLEVISLLSHEEELRWIDTIEEEIFGFLADAERAIGEIKKAPVKRAPRGAPLKVGAEKLANCAATTFWKLKGKPPTRSIRRVPQSAAGEIEQDMEPNGPYFKFVNSLFRHFNVSGDPDYYAKKAVRKWTNDRATKLNSASGN